MWPVVFSKNVSILLEVLGQGLERFHEQTAVHYALALLLGETTECFWVQWKREAHQGLSQARFQLFLHLATLGFKLVKAVLKLVELKGVFGVFEQGVSIVCGILRRSNDEVFHPLSSNRSLLQEVSHQVKEIIAFGLDNLSTASREQEEFYKTEDDNSNKDQLDSFGDIGCDVKAVDRRDKRLLVSVSARCIHIHIGAWQMNLLVFYRTIKHTANRRSRIGELVGMFGVSEIDHRECKEGDRWYLDKIRIPGEEI